MEAAVDVNLYIPYGTSGIFVFSTFFSVEGGLF